MRHCRKLLASAAVQSAATVGAAPAADAAVAIDAAAATAAIVCVCLLCLEFDETFRILRAADQDLQP